MSSGNDLQSYFNQLSFDAKDLYLPNKIKELNSPPSPMVFLREYVMPNIPVVIRGGVQGWPAIKKWTDRYLIKALGNRKVTVAMTPNGYADAPVDDKFVLPHEEMMSMEEFLERLNDDNSKDVVYLQKQNSSFTDEFVELLPDASQDIPWASQAFGAVPDAVNFWMGGSGSITSTHKDPYENLYAVVRGAKTFLLFPPIDVCHLPYELYTTARFKRLKNGDYDIVDVINEQCCHCCDVMEKIDLIENESLSESKEDHSEIPYLRECSHDCHVTKKVPWVSLNPLQLQQPKDKEIFKKCHPITATLLAGDLLYLPSLWFHHVTQQDGTIAVNFWYDMIYDCKYAYFKFLENLSQPVLKSLNA